MDENANKLWEETWPREMHDDYEQVQRILSSRDKKVVQAEKKVVINIPGMLIKGSADEKYETLLTECSCPDYFIRRKPCKHMYYLANELGLLDPLPEYSKTKSTFDVKKEVGKYKEEFLKGNISAPVYVAVCKALEKL